MKQLHRPLGDLADFINGVAFRPEDWGEDGTKIIRIQNLTDGSKPYNRTNRQVDTKYIVRKGDILVSWSASLGVFIWDDDEPAFVNQHIFKVVPKSDVVDKGYLRHALEGALNEMEKHLHGATMQHVNRAEFLGTKIPLPPMEEQRRIATILDQAEGLRAKRRQALAKLDAFTQSLFLDMFGDPATNSKDLKIEPLGKHLQFITSGGRGWARFYASSGARFIRSLDVQMNYIGAQDVVYVNPPDNAEARRTKVKTGDVLLTITGSRIGRVAAAGKDLEGAYISQHVAILRTKPDGIDPDFLSFFLSLDAGGQRQIAASQYGQTKPGLNFDQIQRFAIPVPALDLQWEFRRRLMSFEKLKASGSTAMTCQDTLFSSIQHRAFRGEL